jgi:hypothetical protein
MLLLSETAKQARMGLVNFFVSFPELLIGGVANGDLPVETRFFARYRGLHGLSDDFPLHNGPSSNKETLTRAMHVMHHVHAAAIVVAIVPSANYITAKERFNQSVTVIVGPGMFAASWALDITSSAIS